MFLHFLQTKEHKEAFLELAHIVANADGFVTRNEQGSLRSFMNEMGMTEPLLSISANRDLKAIIGDVTDERIKNLMFAEIMLLIYADGNYDEEEKLIVKEIRGLFGISDQTYANFKSWVIRMDELKIEGMKLILDPTNKGR